MIELLAKGLISGAVVVAASEASKRSSLAGAILISLPLTSILALFWLYAGTNDVEAVRSFAVSIAWIVLPSIAMFVILAVLLKNGIHFYPAIGVSIVGMVAAYAVYAALLKKLGVTI